MGRAYEKVRAFIERHSMLGSSSGIVVAVSGGADSVALLDMLVRLRESSLQAQRAPYITIHVAHLDHRLRGRESAEDAEFVSRLAQSLGLPLTADSADVAAESARSGRGIEETARELRYRFLSATALAAGCDRIATGHTMNDQAETFLMRLARGAGLRGLASIRPVSVLQGSGGGGGGGGGGGRIKKKKKKTKQHPPHPPKPLLCVTREEVEGYCRERGLEFRTDMTNFSLDYARNRVRLTALPALAGVNPRAVENIARATEAIAEDEDALFRVASLLLDEARVGSATGISKAAARSEIFAYSVTAMLGRPAGLRRRMIIEAIVRAREANPGQAAQITAAHVASVERLLNDGASGRHIELPGGLQAWREFNALVFRSAGPLRTVEGLPFESEISASNPTVEAGGFRISLERGIATDQFDRVIGEARLERNRAGRDWMIVALDDCALPERLSVRPRRAGEQAGVLGGRRTKKLKNLMIDHKIPTSRRADWPIVATPDGRYVWSPGLPPAEEFAARDKAKSLARLRASTV
jgi:tRNA(Ile)-lysidine synthetase-like protein